MTKKEVDVLLGRLCVKLGLCLPPDDIEQLSNEPPEDPLAFVDEVFRREGLDPATADRRLYRKVRDVVIEANRDQAGDEWE